MEEIKVVEEIKIVKEIKESIDKLLLVITQLQDLAKQHNKMFLDVYERVSSLEKLHEKIEGEDMGAHTP